jgi:hypothetical protein
MSNALLLKEKQTNLEHEFRALCKEERMLQAVYNKVLRIKDDGQGAWWCALDRWYAEIKPALSKYVGWGAWLPAMRTSEKYDVVYGYLLSLLPPCRGKCPCGGGE